MKKIKPMHLLLSGGAIAIGIWLLTKKKPVAPEPPPEKEPEQPVVITPSPSTVIPTVPPKYLKLELNGIDVLRIDAIEMVKVNNNIELLRPIEVSSPLEHIAIEWTNIIYTIDKWSAQGMWFQLALVPQIPYESAGTDEEGNPLPPLNVPSYFSRGAGLPSVGSTQLENIEAYGSGWLLPGMFDGKFRIQYMEGNSYEFLQSSPVGTFEIKNLLKVNREVHVRAPGAPW